MACPFFFPIEKYADPAFTIQPRLPLGAAFLGECRSQDIPFSMNATTLRRHCNSGYGRGSCDRFPAHAELDAVRFHLAGSDDESIRVRCIRERDCWPAGSQMLVYLRTERRFSEPLQDPVLQRQAEAFVTSVC